MIMMGVLLVVAVHHISKHKMWREENRILVSDARTYYAFLPDWFMESQRDDQSHGLWLITGPNEKLQFKYTMGVALLEMPFYLIPHLTSSSTDPYGAPFRLWMEICGLFYLFLGLWFVRKILLRFYSEAVTAFTLFLIFMGTNLFHYSMNEPVMSHVFSFALIAMYLYVSLDIHEKSSWKRLVALGVLGGLILLVRPVNGIFMLFPLFILWKRSGSLKSLAEWIKQHTMKILLALFCLFILLFFQLLYWKITSEHWLIDTYAGEKFFFDRPRLLEGWFSYRKGFFVYTPLMILIFPGFWWARKQIWGTASWVLFLISSYVFYSWWSWWYGGGFGMRVMVDAFPLLALPLAAALHQFTCWKFFLWHAILIPSMLFLVYLNLYQTEQYRIGALHWADMNKKAYWHQFMKKSLTKEEADSLFTPYDDQKALRGEDDYHFNPFR